MIILNLKGGNLPKQSHNAKIYISHVKDLLIIKWR